MESLSLAQRRALAHVRAHAIATRGSAEDVLDGIARRGAIPRAQLDAAMDGLRRSGQVAVHFHPDRILTGEGTVAAALLSEGRYRNQFETGISNGSLTGFTGGDRDRWETKLFGGAYAPAEPGERPKYGALDFLGFSDGPVPFFGACFFVLKQDVLSRCTFTFGDSCEAEHAGVVGEMRAVFAAMMKFVEKGCSFTGEYLSVSELVRHLARRSASQTPSAPRLGRILEHYIEVQVHGAIDLARDVRLLVADPSYRGTPAGRVLGALQHRYAVPLQWHPGYSLPVARVPDDFEGPLFERARGLRMPALARRIAAEGVLDAAVIGRAAAALDPRAGSFAEAIKDINHLWYLLVRFGTPHPHPSEIPADRRIEPVA